MKKETSQTPIDTKKLAGLAPGPKKQRGGFTDANVRDMLAAIRRGIPAIVICEQLGVENTSFYTKLGVWLLHSKVEVESK